MCITVKLTGLLLHLFKSDGDSFAFRLSFKISSSAKLILKKRISKHYKKNQRGQIPNSSKFSLLK